MQTNLTYGSVCSGIEAASVAWECLGMTPSWFSEIDKFPSAVLAHHWPEVPNEGDMTALPSRVRDGEVSAPHILVGGTPCQAFSVAGARKGMADKRGQLTIAFGELADAIDEVRINNGEQPAVIVWENVKGVLSSKDNAFGAFLGLLSGEECELEPPGGKWSNAGYVSGPKRAIAWRVLDAQYFGVAQRRQRVFVVASARTDVDPAKVLFESDGVRRDTAPSRETGAQVSALTANGVGMRGADDNQAQAGHLIPICMAHGQGGAEIKTDDSAPTLTCNHEVPIIFSSTGAGCWSEGAGTLRARQQESHEHLAVMSVHGTQDPDTNMNLAHTLGTNHGQENAVMAFSSKDYGGDASYELSPTLKSCGHGSSHANGGGPPAVAMYYSVRRLTPVECERLQGFPDNHTLIPHGKIKKLFDEELLYLRLHYPDMSEDEARRQAADGPRYKAIGNSMAIPVMRWIGKRILFQISTVSIPQTGVLNCK